jgi:hypothetical protein
MLTVREAHRLWCERTGSRLSLAGFKLHLRRGRIPGARLMQDARGSYWMIPEDFIHTFNPPPRGWIKGRKRGPRAA